MPLKNLLLKCIRHFITSFDCFVKFNFPALWGFWFLVFDSFFPSLMMFSALVPVLGIAVGFCPVWLLMRRGYARFTSLGFVMRGNELHLSGLERLVPLTSVGWWIHSRFQSELWRSFEGSIRVLTGSEWNAERIHHPTDIEATGLHWKTWSRVQWGYHLCWF